MAAIGSHFEWGEFHVNIFRNDEKEEYISFILNGARYDLPPDQSKQFNYFIENYFSGKPLPN